MADGPRRLLTASEKLEGMKRRDIGRHHKEATLFKSDFSGNGTQGAFVFVAWPPSEWTWCHAQITPREYILIGKIQATITAVDAFFFPNTSPNILLEYLCSQLVKCACGCTELRGSNDRG